MTMFDLTLIGLVICAVILLIGIAIGFTLSRNSKKGNALFNQAVERAERAEEQLREWRAASRNKKDEQ
jgi:uncharacterized protein (UPF0333 family)